VPRQPLSELIDAITLDAYGTDEQLTAFLTVFDEQVALPCAAKVLDIEVEVLGFDLEGDERRAWWRVAVVWVGVLAWCRLPMSASSLGQWRRGCTLRSGAGSGSGRSPLGGRRAGAGRSHELR
jgi:hypothetical protein